MVPLSPRGVPRPCRPGLVQARVPARDTGHDHRHRLGRDSRITVTLICPGLSNSFSISRVFGDDSISDLDHARLWGNLVTWAARSPEGHGSATAGRPEFAALEGEAVEALRPYTAKDGTFDGDPGPDPRGGREGGRAGPRFPHDAAYLSAVQRDLGKWAETRRRQARLPRLAQRLPPRRAAGRRSGAPRGVPDVHPERQPEPATWRRSGSGPSGRSGCADLEAGGYDNPMFVPIAFEDFTAGYDTNSAVLFPETVVVRETPTALHLGRHLLPTARPPGSAW